MPARSNPERKIRWDVLHSLAELEAGVRAGKLRNCEECGAFLGLTQAHDCPVKA